MYGIRPAPVTGCVPLEGFQERTSAGRARKEPVRQKSQWRAADFSSPN